MYKVNLSRSEFPAIAKGQIEHISIGEALARAAEDSGGLLALREITLAGEIGRSWTYRALYDDARRLATALLGRHAPGDRIAIFAHNVPECVLMEYAAALAGLTLVTVNPSFQPREVKYVVEQSRAAGIYVVENYRGNPIAKIAREVAAEVPAVAHVIDVCDADAMDAGADPARAAESRPARSRADPIHVGDDRLSQGRRAAPRGALQQRQADPRTLGRQRRRQVLEPDAAVSHRRLRPCRPRVLEPPGGALPCRAVRCAGTRQNRRGGARDGTPGRADNDHCARRSPGGGEPRCFLAAGIFSGGSMVAPELVKRAQRTFSAPFQIVYGQTETSPVLTAMWGEGSFEDVTETVGQPLPHTELSIRDPATNAVVPVGAVGEICARGYMIMLEYNDNPDATKKTIDAQGWLHTGDLGTMDARGFVKITGRVKEMIIRGGENLFPAEIENAMLEHAAISEVAVVGLPDERFGEIVACFLRTKGGARPTKEELIKHCRSILSPQKTPSVWAYVEEWPLTGSGKIRKFLLREMYEAGKFKGRTL